MKNLEEMKQELFEKKYLKISGETELYVLNSWEEYLEKILSLTEKEYEELNKDKNSFYEDLKKFFICTRKRMVYWINWEEEEKTISSKLIDALEINGETIFTELPQSNEFVFKGKNYYKDRNGTWE